MILLLAKGEGLYALNKVFEGKNCISLSDATRSYDELRKEALRACSYGDIEFVVANGLSCAGVLGAIAGKGHPTVGATPQHWNLEMDKPYGKRLCEEVGIGTSEWCTVGLDEIDTHPWRFPCYVKHRVAQGGTTSFKVASVRQVKNLVAVYGYERGFIVEQPLEGIEFSMNALVGAKNWRVIGVNYDMKGSTGKVVGNAYMTAGPWVASVERTLAPLFDRVQGLGYRGVLAVTVFLTKYGLKVIELNVRVGTGSGYTYLYNVGNMAEMLEACAKGEEIPRPWYRRTFGLSVAVDSGLRRDSYDLKVGTLAPLDEGVALIPNNVRGPYSNGQTPFLLAGFGQSSLQSVGGTLLENLERMDVPLLVMPTLDLDRFDLLMKELANG